jgi:two-component system response regulator AlgR
MVAECGEPRCTVAGEAANASQALVWLTTHECDLLLLDVQMPGRDGTQLAAELRMKSPAPAIVFVTAHAQHALKAFDLEAVDYLTKPVKRERLQMALRRVHQRLAGGLPVTAQPQPAKEEGPVIVVSDRGRIIRVPVADVLYLKAELKYVTLRTAEHTHVLDDSLAELEERLGEHFLRVHRNALVARARGALRSNAHPRRRSGRGRLRRLGRLHGTGRRMAGVSRRQVAAVRRRWSRSGANPAMPPRDSS